MPIEHPMYPCVNSSLKRTRGHIYRGNTFGQIDAYHDSTEVAKEKAKRFNVQEKLREAKKKRRQVELA